MWVNRYLRAYKVLIIVRNERNKSMSKKNLIYLIVMAIITITLLYVSDQVLTLNYVIKSAVKVFLFSIFPIIYTIQTGKNVLKDSVLNMRKSEANMHGIRVSLLLGITITIIIIATYVLIVPYIDTKQLILEFEEKYRINKYNIIYYSLYLVFINSFLEEFFFRGFLFINIKKTGRRKTAYIFSSFMFAIYHIANFQNWFSVGVFILALSGLFIGGCIFCYLDDEKDSFINSWLVHICADLGIVLVGLHIFDVISIGKWYYLG